jgi:tetratricopeptide (TPR) repeat protein
VEALPLPPLGRPASQELLLSPRAKGKKTTAAALLADPATATDADAICEALGDLPLALALAGAYLETTPSATLARYRADIAAAPLARLETPLDEPLPTGHEASILKTFALSYDKLDANKPDDALARTILHRAALLAPAPIPRRLLLRAAGLDPADAYAQEQADHALRRLAALGLIEDLGDEEVRLHRLLAAYARHRAAAPAEDGAAIEDALSDEVYAINMDGYPLVGVPYLPHLQQAATLADARGDESAATFLNNVGVLLKIQGDLSAAQSYAERALTICEQTLGPTHPNTASGLNNVGLLLKAQGDIVGARPYYERALEIRKETLGLTDLDTAQSFNNLGSLLQDLGDFAVALPYFQQALAIYESIHGSDHPGTATILNNLGSLLQDLGDFVEARSYYERALEIRERQLGHNHPDTAATFSNLGSLFEDLNDHAGAQPYYEQALAIDRASYGEDHLEVAKDLMKLGHLVQKLDDWGRARSYYERALEIREQKLGPTHLDTATSLIELGALQYKQGDLPAALALLKRACAIWEQKLGPDHPNTQATRGARNIVQRALEAAEEQPGHLS